MSEILDQIRLWMEYLITTLGYSGLALVMFIENVFPPIPSEMIMPFAGFMVNQRQFTFAGILLAGTVGSVLGSLALYYVGMWVGEGPIRVFLRHYGRWFLVSEQDLDRAMSFFDRYGGAMILFGRLIPGVRSLISLPAGMQRMSLIRFLSYTTLGSAVWTGLLGYAGIVLNDNWESILLVIDQYEFLLLAAMVATVVGFIIWRVFWLVFSQPPANDFE